MTQQGTCTVCGASFTACNGPAACQANLARKRVAEVNSRLAEEWGIGIESIPEDRLAEEIAYVLKAGPSTSNPRKELCVKIPSRSEFSMTLAEGQAVLATLRANAPPCWDKRWSR